jgi:excisionase family DNA binding protein
MSRDEPSVTGGSRRPATPASRRPAGTLPQLLTIDELADHLGVGARHVRRLIAERRVPYVKWGHLIRFDPDEIAAWLDENRRRASSAG